MNKIDDEMKNPIKNLLEENPIFKDDFYNKLLKEGFHIQAIVKGPDEWSHLSEKQREIRCTYFSICSLDEVERIIAPSDASDSLLRIRADSVLSNQRIFRTFQNKASIIKASEWNLTSQFDDSILEDFKNEVQKKYKDRIDEIFFGTLYSDFANGFIEQTKYGPRIIISEALKFFLYFMNLGFYGFWDDDEVEILIETKSQGILIGIRTMLLKESFDFELDPRGNVPLEVHEKLEQIVNVQLFFIIAHEYAHFLLNHLDDDYLSEKKLFNVNPSHPNLKPKTLNIYAQSQIKEFEADELAIEILCDDDVDKKKMVLLYAIFIMSYLDIFDSLKEAINRKRNPKRSHPSPIKRREKMMGFGKQIWDDDQLRIAKQTIQFSKIVKKRLIKHYSQHPSSITTYGSIYLSQWKDRKLIDRVDY